MGPLSLTASRVGLAAAAGQAISSITTFIATIRAAKADLGALRSEHIALQDVLDGMQISISSHQDSITEDSESRIQDLIQDCHGVISRIEGLLERQRSSRLGQSIKRTVSGKKRLGSSGSISRRIGTP
jgi:hypothetical protein